MDEVWIPVVVLAILVTVLVTLIVRANRRYWHRQKKEAADMLIPPAPVKRADVEGIPVGKPEDLPDLPLVLPFTTDYEDVQQLVMRYTFHKGGAVYATQTDDGSWLIDAVKEGNR